MNLFKVPSALFLFFIMVILPAVVVGEEKEEDLGATLVEAAGVAPLTEAGVAPARKVAIDDALKQAVEQARGVMVKSETLVKDFTTVRDEILSQSRGFVKRYEILKEKKMEEDKTYRVEIQAYVLLNDPKTPAVKLDDTSFQKKVPKILAEIEALSRRTNEIAKKTNSKEFEGLKRDGFIILGNRYRTVIQVLDSIQPPPGKEKLHERLKEAVALKARATFFYGRYLFKEKQAEVLQRANQLNKRGNEFLREQKKPGKDRQAPTGNPPKA
jgi:O6-methylguanine-DNA--protein-cysteine methyltransferase